MHCEKLKVLLCCWIFHFFIHNRSQRSLNLYVDSKVSLCFIRALAQDFSCALKNMLCHESIMFNKPPKPSYVILAHKSNYLWVVLLDELKECIFFVVVNQLKLICTNILPDLYWLIDGFTLYRSNQINWSWSWRFLQISHIWY